MYIEAEGKPPETLANAVERGTLQLDELPLSMRNKVAVVLNQREKEKENGKVPKTGAKVPGEPESEAKSATKATARPKAKAKAKK